MLRAHGITIGGGGGGVGLMPFRAPDGWFTTELLLLGSCVTYVLILIDLNI